MAVIQDKVQIGSSSDFLDGVSVNTPAGTDLFREAVVTADPEIGDALARVRAAEPASDDYGSVVRPVGVNQRLDAIRDGQGAVDVFGHAVVSQRINQIEVPLNDANWLDFVDVSGSGSASQGNGQVQISSGTGINGSYKVISKDFVQYRSGAEIGWGFTWRFPTPGVLGSYQRIGATDNTWANGVWIGYEATAFGISYARNGSVIWSRTPAQWLDPCDGSAGSGYTLNGAPVAMDVTKDQLVRIRAGLFGHAGFVVEIRTPDGDWLKLIDFTGINALTVAVFGDFDLKIAMEAKKTGADATNLQIVSACFAGWTGVSQMRMNSAITDRTLAQTTRTVIEGKTTAGGGAYVPVKVNPSGALAADVTGSTVRATDSTDLEYTSVATTVTAIGDTTIYTPATGKAVRLHWIYAMNDPMAATSTVITVKIGSQVLYVTYGVSKRQQFTGAVNAALIINLSAAGNVAVTAFVEEV